MSTIEIELPEMPSAEDLVPKLGTDEWLLGTVDGNGRIARGLSASVIDGKLHISEWSWRESEPQWQQVKSVVLDAAALRDLRRFLADDPGRSTLFARETD